MLIRNIKALRKIIITTGVDEKTLEKDEVNLVRFENPRQFKEMLKLGNFIEYTGPVPKEIKGPSNPKGLTTMTPPPMDIPVINPPSLKDDVIDTHKDASAPHCDKCNVDMIFTITKEGNAYFCPVCQVVKSNPSEPVADENVNKQGPTTPSTVEKPKRASYTCPLCGKRRAKANIYCKTCMKKSETN